MENQTQAGITLADLANAVQIIDMASARGAIRGEELAPVGALRTRLVAFLNANQAKNEVPVDASEAPAETPAE